MSDMDAQLGAIADRAYGATSGSDVIDTATNVSIEPDKRSGPVSEHDAQIEDQRKQSDKLEAELGKSYDAFMARMLPKEAARPRPVGDTLEAQLDSSYELNRMPKSEQQAIGKAQTSVESVEAAGKHFNMPIRDADGNIDPVKYQAVRALMDGDKAGEAKPQDTSPSEWQREAWPEAKTRAEADQRSSQVVLGAKQVWNTYSTHGPQATFDALAQHGLRLPSPYDPQVRLQIQAEDYGTTVGALLDRAGYIPAERVQEMVQEQLAQHAIVEFSRGRPDFEAVRAEMGALVNTEGYMREGESWGALLERAHRDVMRKRSREPIKSAVDKALEAIGAKHYGAA